MHRNNAPAHEYILHGLWCAAVQRAAIALPALCISCNNNNYILQLENKNKKNLREKTKKQRDWIDKILPVRTFTGFCLTSRTAVYRVYSCAIRRSIWWVRAHSNSGNRNSKNGRPGEREGWAPHIVPTEGLMVIVRYRPNTRAPWTWWKNFCRTTKSIPYKGISRSDRHHSNPIVLSSDVKMCRNCQKITKKLVEEKNWCEKNKILFFKLFCTAALF